MPDASAGHVVAEIQRNSRSAVRIVLRAKQGVIGLELKLAERNARGRLIETPRGVRMPVARLREAIEALRTAEREAVRLGLIAPANG